MPVQGGLVENDYVVEALAAHRTDDAFHVGTLPRGSRRRQNFLDSHVFHIFRKLTAEDPVPVAKQVTRDLLKGKGLPELLRGPLGRRMSGDVEMHDPPSVVSQNQRGAPQSGFSRLIFRISWRISFDTLSVRPRS